jgi:hypothetical protein
MGRDQRIEVPVLERQPWTREQVKTFLQAAWDYVGFE